MHELGADDVGVAVGGGAAIFEVAAAVFFGVAANADRAAAVGNTVAEFVHARSLESAGHAELVALAVHAHVLDVLGGELVDGGLDDGESSGFPHLLRGHVSVHPGPVPVALRDGLGVEGAEDLVLLTHPLKDVAGRPQLIASVDSNAGTDLVLPLPGHDLAVRPGDVEPREEARR